VSISLSRWSALAFAAGIMMFLAACVFADGGYGYDDGGTGAGYYEPYGTVYGGWGPDYGVAPFRDGGHRGNYGNAAHAYRSAPASHAMPSLSSRSRSEGNSRSGDSRWH